MSEVIRISDEMLADLNAFTTLYIKELEKRSSESPLCRTLLQEHLNYSLNSQVGFAIRYAANNLRQEINNISLLT